MSSGGVFAPGERGGAEHQRGGERESQAVTAPGEEQAEGGSAGAHSGVVGRVPHRADRSVARSGDAVVHHRERGVLGETEPDSEQGDAGEHHSGVGDADHEQHA
jgi:hypothetical protein